MKINSCNIASFGKFKNYKIDFTDGFNVIYGENEAGKSTLMAFIKMMFYGNGGRVSDISRNLRLKYTPWDSSFMAGSIDFSKDGKNYRIEREFRGSNATDKITVIDLDLKTEVKIGAKGDIGSELFGLSEAAFEKSLFVGSFMPPEKNAAAEGELNGRLSNLAATGDEDISLELVAGRIKKAKEKYMSKSGKIGIYDKGVAKLAELQNELSLARSAEAEAAELEAVIHEKEAEAARITAESNRYFGIMKKAELFKKKQNLEKYVSAYEAKSAAEKNLAIPDGKIADKAYIEAIKSARSDFSSAEKNLLEKQSEEGRLNSEIKELKKNTDSSFSSLLSSKKKSLEAELETLEAEADTVQKTVFEKQLISAAGKKRKTNLPLVIIGPALTLIFGIATAFMPKSLQIASIPLFYLTTIGTLLGIILFTLAFVIKKDSKNAPVFEDLSRLQRELDSLLTKIAEKRDELKNTESQLNNAFIEINSNKALIDAKQSELISKSEAVLSAKNDIFEKKSILARLCEPFGSFEAADGIIEKLEALISEIISCDVMLKLAADSTNAGSYEEAVKRLSDLDADQALKDVSADEIASAKDRFRSLTEQSGKLKEELATLKIRLKGILSSGKTVPVLENQITELQNKTAYEKKFCDAADIALEVLTDSFSAMRQSFGGLLERETGEIFSGLCNNAYSAIDISRDFDIRVTHEGTFGAKDWQFLSSGTADQAYLSLRLALVRLIGNERDALPVIMDDPLSQYDDTRAEAAMKYLTDYSKEHQLILFTCHNEIKRLAENMGIKSINI